MLLQTERSISEISRMLAHEKEQWQTDHEGQTAAIGRERSQHIAEIALL